MAQKANKQNRGTNLLVLESKKSFFIYIKRTVVRFIFRLRAVNIYGRESAKAWNGYLVRRVQCAK